MQSIVKLLEGQTLLTVSVDWSVQKVAELMAERRIGAVPVTDGNRLVGMFSERDLVTRIIVARKDPETTVVSEVMTDKLVVADFDNDYQTCLEKMKSASCRHLPIVQEEKLIGILSMRDLLAHDVAEKEFEIRTLNEYIYQVPISK